MTEKREQFQAGRVVVTPINKLVGKILNWGRKSSLWPAHFVNGCCSPELMQLAGPRYDMERFGVLPMPSIRYADAIFIVGVISRKMAERIKMLYEQMPDPKFVIAFGSCAISKGPFYDSPFVVKAEDIVPVDVFVPGCPPRPEAWLHGILMLREMIWRGEKT
ncbi:MAG: NADH-quinone oxidoreductase subunit B [Candidatus Bathyarchaeia archaeon]